MAKIRRRRRTDDKEVNGTAETGEMVLLLASSVINGLFRDSPAGVRLRGGEAGSTFSIPLSCLLLASVPSVGRDPPRGLFKA